MTAPLPEIAAGLSEVSEKSQPDGPGMYRCYWEAGQMKSVRISPEEFYLTAAHIERQDHDH